ncbi:MAG: hypothetical protein H0T91_10580 [Propionibacteriaceae bacterium]|nr:hypothetical protein [Propionibacteriaceae bacterium]
MRLLVVLFLALLAALSGCTYSQQEPGLFRQKTIAPQPSPAPEVPRQLPERTNPLLPVAGRAVWTSGEGLDIQTVFAVHAIRRVEGATVLDWSVTPVKGAGLAIGDDIPAWVNLGLTRESVGDVNIHLIDPDTSKVYRPLNHESRREFSRCLCSPLWVAQLSLRIGETRLLQVTYPELPASVRFLDVNMVTLPPFSHVPVTAVGQVPTTKQPTDLTRPPDQPPALTSPLAFRYPSDDSNFRQSIVIEEIIASSALTSVRWQITSLTDQPSFSLLPSGSPVSAVLPPNVLVVSPGSASGPQIRPAGTPSASVTSAQWITVRQQGRGFFECLCTDLGLWASSLRQAGGTVTVTTNYPALPAGVSKVDVILPGVATVRALPVTPAVDSAAQVGAAIDSRIGHWAYTVADPPRGWRTADWPVPVPAPSQLRHYLSTVDDLVELPR